MTRGSGDADECAARGGQDKGGKDPALFIPARIKAMVGTRTCKPHALPLYTGGAGESLARSNMYYKQIAELTTRIIEAEQPEKIILFGSYASGTATESSDIDLLVISRSTLPRPERELRLTRQLFGSGVPYDLLVLTPEEMEERLRRNGPFIREILSTGQVVYQRT
jgi:predicted nucleotidyltransferase